MFLVFSSCPRTCTTFLINCTNYIITNYGITKKIEQLSDASHYFHYKHCSDKHFIIKMETFIQTHHNIIPKEEKLVIHSSRDYKNSIDSLNRLSLDNNRKHQTMTENILQEYDEFCKKEADILFEYKNIRENKKKEIERLVAFFKEKQMIEKDMEIHISEIINHADTTGLKWKNHKKW